MCVLRRWAVGRYGTIMTTTDGGDGWILRGVGIDSTIVMYDVAQQPVQVRCRSKCIPYKILPPGFFFRIGRERGSGNRCGQLLGKEKGG
jgi:hypothetical protein